MICCVRLFHVFYHSIHRSLVGHRQSAQRSSRISPGAKPAFLLPPTERPLHGKKTTFLHSASDRNLWFLWISEEIKFPSSLICKWILLYACSDQCYTYRNALNTDTGYIAVGTMPQAEMATDKQKERVCSKNNMPRMTDASPHAVCTVDWIQVKWNNKYCVSFSV